MFVAIQQQNLRNPIVFGIGATKAEALTDASRNAEAMDGLEVVPCTPELAAAVKRGTVDCTMTNGVAGV